MSHSWRGRAKPTFSRHEHVERERRSRRDARRRADDGRFATYRVLREQLPPARMAQEKQDAIAHASGQAVGAGFRVVDVVRADWQDNGDWLVELAVESAA